MGERKGVNKYYPPDWTPEQGGINKYHGTHALRERARKLHMGILIIRFEMPYNIWCEGCKNHIGMGVRYNAEKKKIGMYYSTPVYQFRMKCHLCDNHFEIKTDPGNLDYVIISGARRQERRWDPTENGQVVPEDKAVSRKLASDSMFKLEHGVADTEKAKDSRPAIAKLQSKQEVWRDDYEANRRLRDIMRAKKKEEKNQLAEDKQLLAKGSLDIPLLPKSEDDSRTAALLRLIPQQSPEEKRKERRDAIETASIFGVKRKLSDRQLRLLVAPSLEGIIKKKKIESSEEDSEIAGEIDEGAITTIGSDNEFVGELGEEKVKGTESINADFPKSSSNTEVSESDTGLADGSGTDENGRINVSGIEVDEARESAKLYSEGKSGSLEISMPGGSGIVSASNGLSFVCDYDSSSSDNGSDVDAILSVSEERSELPKFPVGKTQLPNPFSSGK